MSRQSYIYIMTNMGNTVLYTGVTSDLKRRTYQHGEGTGGSFTRRYKATKLVYFEIFENIIEAITREKQIKAGSRAKKIELINGMNPTWRDLYDEQ